MPIGPPVDGLLGNGAKLGLRVAEKAAPDPTSLCPKLGSSTLPAALLGCAIGIEVVAVESIYSLG